MKKILLQAFILSVILTGCDMNESEPGKIPDTNSIETAEDCAAFRNNNYSGLRALMAGTYITNAELESDYYVAVVGNGNRGMYMNLATLNSSLGDVTDPYNGCYSALKNINFLLEKGQEIINNGNLTATDLVSVKRYMAENHFMRAYIYYYLFDHYCQAFSTDKANTEGLGLSIVTTYAPTGDTSKYPGRSTMAALKELVDNDLTAAFDGLKEYEQSGVVGCNDNLVPNAPYLSSYAVAAMQARWALLTKDFTTAVSKAEYVIASGIYPLCSGNKYEKIWTNDEGDELIFVPFVNDSESSYVGSFNDAWNYYATFPDRSDYIPSYSTLSMYDNTDDIRFKSFFIENDMTVSGVEYTANIFFKFPGNDNLISGTNYYKNKPKPFRSSEMYLIIAEACSTEGPAKNESKANNALNEIRKARYCGDGTYEDNTYSGVSLINEVRLERKKELIGEGFRLSDLKRWGLGFTRDGSYPINPEVENIIVGSSAGVNFSPNDYRYTWPIPSSEMEINPQLKGQQNPGY